MEFKKGFIKDAKNIEIQNRWQPALGDFVIYKNEVTPIVLSHSMIPTLIDIFRNDYTFLPTIGWLLYECEFEYLKGTPESNGWNMVICDFLSWWEKYNADNFINDTEIESGLLTYLLCLIKENKINDKQKTITT